MILMEINVENAIECLWPSYSELLPSCSHDHSILCVLGEWSITLQSSKRLECGSPAEPCWACMGYTSNISKVQV